ncbi:hypothetical protein ACIQJT_04580 [Streptomyces sp. NPDC091972]|uniref:hypothetical protein n=1 Tax=Streptomyces sp. NPDC091972 TaxID=3366007 RepID=UPI003820E5BA
MPLRHFAATALGCAMVLSVTATSADAASPTPTRATAAQVCTPGGPNSVIKGTNVTMRDTPGGRWVGTAQNGDCVYWYAAISGPSAVCPDGRVSHVWHDVFNYRLLVRGWVSDCFF